MADSDVQLPPNSTGPLVDTSQVTTTAGTVQRQRITLGDPINGNNLAGVSLSGKLSINQDEMSAILLELRRIAMGIEMLLGSDIPYED